MRLLHACPLACKRLPVDLTDSQPARERLRAPELIDSLVAGGMLRGDALRSVGLAKSTRLARGAPPRRSHSPRSAQHPPAPGPAPAVAPPRPPLSRGRAPPSALERAHHHPRHPPP